MLATWNKLNRNTKIVIIVLMFLVFCCCITPTIGSLLPQVEPTQTPQPTSTSVAIETLEPTQPPQPTQSATPASSIDIVGYIQTLDARLLSIREALDDLASVELEYANNPDLFDDNDWYFKSTNILFRLQTGAKELSEMQSGNESPATLETLLDDFFEITNEMATSYIQGIDTKDAALIETASNQLPIIEEKLSEIMDELNKRK